MEKRLSYNYLETEWGTVTMETEEINQVLTCLSTKKISELNELIYVEAKLVCEKTGISLKSNNKKSKLRWDIRLETQIRNL